MAVSDGIRIALISDIHGNSIALDAVLADIDIVGVDEVWALGDLVALGPDPVGVLDRLSEVPEVQVLRGNTDRYTATGAVPDAPHGRPSPMHDGIVASFPWAAQVLDGTGWLPWLEELPSHLRQQLPDGTRLLAVHATPNRDDGRGMRADADDGELDAIVLRSDANLLCGGHTHRPFVRALPNGTVVNLGSVSNPPRGDRRASYAVVDATTHATVVHHRKVEYDWQRVLEQLDQLGHPGREFISQHFEVA